MVNNQMLEFAKCAKDPVYYMNTYGYVFNAKERRVTQMTCFEYQNKCLRDFHKYQNNIILKSRQCLPGNTYVDTPGGPRAIKDFKVGDKVYSYNIKSDKVEVDTVYDAWCSGNRQCVKFKLQDTRNFEVGENHPFYVKDIGWVKAKNLKRGDEILDANIGFGEANPSEDEIKILAYLITDGCTNKQVKFTNNNLKYLKEFEDSVNNVFPELSVRKTPKLNGYDYFPHQSHGTNMKNPIMEWCDKKGIANKKTKFKLLPEEVFAWNKKSTSLLINRMFAGDGWVSILKKGDNSKRLELGIASPSEEFLQQVKSLLKKFNIKCNIYEIKNMKLQQNRFFKLRITHSKSAKRFINNIGIFDKTTQEHYDICDSYKHDVKDNSIIKKIERTEVKKCYDISVNKNENFLVNGLLTHNTGLSVITAGYVAWRLLFRYDEKILIIANNGDGAIKFLETVKQFIEHTPAWLKPDSIEQDNTKKIAFSNNSYAEAKASSPNAGRGDSLTMLVLDETAFIKDDEAIWMGAGMALSATGGKCIMISTPNGTSGLYYKTWRETISGDKSAKSEEDFHANTIHWTENPNSSEGLEMKKDGNGNEVPWSPWYEAQCKRLNWDSVQIAQELDLSFEGSKRLAIDTQLVSKYRTMVEKDCKRVGYIKFNFLQKENPIEFAKFTQEETNMHIYKKPEEGISYILASDVARGDGQDYSTIQIFDAESLEQVAEYREKVGPDLFPHVIDAVARMYNTAYVVIEANSFGLGVCFDIRDKFKYPRNKLYFSKNTKDIHVRHYSYKVSEGTEIPGFQTSRKNRVLLVKAIIEHMRENSLILHSKRLMMEFDTFVMNGDKPEHEKGSHDDLIMALGIALYIRDTEFENVTASVKMTKSMLSAMMMNTNSSIGNPNTSKKNVDIKSGGGGLYIFNGNGDNAGGAGDISDDDDISWLLG